MVLAAVPPSSLFPLAVIGATWVLGIILATGVTRVLTGRLPRSLTAVVTITEAPPQLVERDRRKAMRGTRLLLLAATLASGVLASIYEWGQWIAGAVVIAYAAGHLWWIAKYSKKPSPFWRLALVGTGLVLTGCLPTLVGIFVGALVFKGKPPF